MKVLLTSVAHGRFWDRLSRPGVEPLIMDKDGTLLTEAGERVERDAADPEVAWGTSDLFAADAPMRPFLGLIRRATSLKWFQSPAAGYDDPIYKELAGRGVRITNAHVNGIPIAEFVMRAVLDHFQAAQLWRDAQQQRTWATHDWREVSGTTWLVVGLGSIGKRVARRAKAFGATVIGCRQHPQPSDATDRTITLDDVPLVLPEADVVVLCVPDTPRTRGLVDRAFLSRMKSRSVLVNVGRGSLVDEDALLRSLERGIPEVAILDVFATEPLPSEHPFWKHPAVTVTAHNAAGGTGRYARQAGLFGENLGLYMTNQALRNDVTGRVLA